MGNAPTPLLVSTLTSGSNSAGLNRARGRCATKDGGVCGERGTPVPPSATAMSVAFQTPVAMVPTLVKEDAVTPELSVVPVSVPAAAVTVIFAVPSNDTR